MSGSITEHGLDTGYRKKPDEILDFTFAIDDLKEFVFPTHLQHPLSTGRLYAFAICGPLDSGNNLRCGYRGCRTLQEYELEAMCIQYEREDLIQVYLHHPKDFGSLLTKQQDAIINQADGHLKNAKGKAFLPNITPSELDELFADLPRNSFGKLSFHDAQDAILQYRESKIKKYKLVYPELHINSSNARCGTSNNINMMKTNTAKNSKQIKSLSSTTVSDTVAPAFMFQHMKGYRNADIIDQTNSNMNKHSFKIAALEQLNDSSIISNVKLLREMKPNFDDPYIRTKEKSRMKSEWNSTSNIRGSSIGSAVSSTPSSSTWKQKFTLY